MSFAVREAPKLCGPAGVRCTAPGLRTRVCQLGFVGVPQLRGLFGAGCRAPWAAYKGMPLWFCAVPQQRGLAGEGCTALLRGPGLLCPPPGTAYKSLSFRFCVSPQLRGALLDGDRHCANGYDVQGFAGPRNCTATPVSDARPPGVRARVCHLGLARPRRFRVEGPRDCVGCVF